MPAPALWPHQEAARASTWHAIESGKRAGLVVLPTGTGKCLAKDTPVLMHDGSIKMVQDVAVGDLLMGPDSKPRRVLSLARGREAMYRVTPKKGEPYTVNESHVLSLKMTRGATKGNGARGGKYTAGTVINVSVRDYLDASKTFRHCAKGYRVGVDFAPKPVPLDPYFVGLWLGDGKTTSLEIFNADPEIGEYLQRLANSLGMKLRRWEAPNKCPVYRLSGPTRKWGDNRIRAGLKQIGVLGNKHVPAAYKSNTREVRLELLAGLIDSDGSLTCNGYDCVFKSEALAHDTAYLARSLGLAAYVSPCKKTCCNNGVAGDYFRVSISGDVSIIPVIIARKKAGPRRQKKDVLMTGIKVESVGVSDYYGFEIDGDRLFLLGDFTVTHNTALFSTLARDVGETGGVTLILVHRDELVQQTLKTCRRFWPEHYAAVVQGSRDEWDQRDLYTGRTADLVVASVQSLGEKRLARMPRGLFRLVVADEAHHAVAPSWARVLDHFTPRFTLGVTATPGRLDGKGLAERFGERPLYSYSLYQAIKDGRLVNVTPLGIETRLDLDDVGTGGSGDFAQKQLAGKVNTPERNRIVLQSYLQHARGRRAIGFSVDVQHARDLAALFEEHGVRSCVVHGALPAGERRQLLEDFAAGAYSVAWNCEVLTEGFDDPAVSALLMARPTKSQSLYIQCVGRGLRLAPGKVDCLVLDFTDNCRRHKLVTSLDLLDREGEEGEGGATIEEEERSGREREQREVRIVEWRMAYVCPWPDLPNLDGYVPIMEWQNGPASASALKYLASFGVEARPELTAGQVSYLIDRAKELDAAFPAPASPQQAWALRKHGLWRKGMTRKEAGRIIGQIKKGQRRAAR